VKDSGGLVDQVFVLRFWWEASGDGSRESWRAQIRHVNSRETAIASDVPTTFALIKARLADASGETGHEL
jgi:hypothetical protein